MTPYLQKLFYRCVKRGTKENEIILRAFAERHLMTLESESLRDFEALLDCLDPDLTQWLFDPRRLPSHYDTPVFWLLKDLNDRGIYTHPLSRSGFSKSLGSHGPHVQEVHSGRSTLDFESGILK